MEIHYLRCNYLINPICIDDIKPKLSYILKSSKRNKYQKAYRILVSSSNEKLINNSGDIWDSGKVYSQNTFQIEYEGIKLQSYTRCYWKVMVYDEKDIPTPWSETAYWEMGLLCKEDWKAKWIGYSEINLVSDALATPLYLSKKIEIYKNIEVQYARVYATALGVYELRLNENKIGDSILTPGWTNYNKRVQYQAYDVTALLHRGENSISGLLGNGWYCGLWQMWPPRTHIYGERPELLFQLEIVYKNGEKQIFISDETWKVTTKGPLRFAGIYEGETYDACMEAYLESGNLITSTWHSAELQKDKQISIVVERSEPIKVMQCLKPVSVSEPKPNIYVIDFGQNMVGRLRIKFHEPRDTLITIFHNEVLNEDGTLYLDNLVAGCFVEKVDRQVIRYICKGSDDCYAPTFTYMGFRYIEIRGLTCPPIIDDIVGEVFHTSFKQIGSFECSNMEINRLQQNIQWSQRGNMMGIPTDCPQRDERCGYTGDMQFFMPTSVFNMDMAAFMNKWLVDLCQDSQLENGMYADHAPYFGMSGGNVGWGDAGVICPYLSYKTYGDKSIIKEHYTSMQVYTQFLVDTSNEDFTRGPDCVGLGDWLNLGGGASKEVVGTAYFANILHIMSEIAQAIGKEQDHIKYKELCNRVKKAFVDKFINKEGYILNSSQTGYALAFTMDLIPKELKDKVAKAFTDEIEKFDYRLVTGFIGTPRLLIALNIIGRDDLAYKLLFQRECPSWLYPITVGATTIWERWDAWTKENGFADKCMNSFNHFAFGAVGEYFFRCISGIKQKDITYRSFMINPVLEKGITWAKTRFESINGEICVDWSIVNNKYNLKVQIPVNSQASVYIPCGNVENIFEGNITARNVFGINYISMKDNYTILDCSSGIYEFFILLDK